MPQDTIYTISARGKKANEPVDTFLSTFFPNIPFNKIDSVFGFVEASTLYSGRPFLFRQISDEDTAYLYKNNIGVRIPFTNHYCSSNEYKENLPILEKYHKKGNSVITTNEDLARWIKKDFPDYQLEASIIKNIKTHDEIKRVLDIYDTVVLPMELNYKIDFLQNIEHKEHITLFGNGGCALTCPNRICYDYISKTNKKLAKKGYLSRYFHFFIKMGLNNKWCMYNIKPRKLHGVKDFDLEVYKQMGYRRFKLLRENKDRNSGY